MEKSHFKFKMVNWHLPVYVILMLKRKNTVYPFSFIFCTRDKKEEFILKYSKDQFPPNNSIEIIICETPEEFKIPKTLEKLTEDESDRFHIAFNKIRKPADLYVCHFPGKNHEEALGIAKFWAQYNLMHFETGSTSIDGQEVMGFELDEDIHVLEIG